MLFFPVITEHPPAASSELQKLQTWLASPERYRNFLSYLRQTLHSSLVSWCITLPCLQKDNTGNALWGRRCQPTAGLVDALAQWFHGERISKYKSIHTNVEGIYVGNSAREELIAYRDP